MPKFRKKPVVIEAMKFMGGFSYDDMCEEWGDPFSNVARHNNLMNEIIIKTLEGDMRVSHSDFVIKGVKGEFYPCKPDIFEATYDQVKE